jgi:hypothetical protein
MLFPLGVNIIHFELFLLLFFLGGIENILEPVPLWIYFIEFFSVPPHENNKPSSKNHLIEGKP